MNWYDRLFVWMFGEGEDNTEESLDMLLAKKRAKDRRAWLEEKGNLADV